MIGAFLEDPTIPQSETRWYHETLDEAALWLARNNPFIRAYALKLPANGWLRRG